MTLSDEAARDIASTPAGVARRALFDVSGVGGAGGPPRAAGSIGET
jgi:hypothetical protein